MRQPWGRGRERTEVREPRATSIHQSVGSGRGSLLIWAHAFLLPLHLKSLLTLSPPKGIESVRSFLPTFKTYMLAAKCDCKRHSGIVKSQNYGFRWPVQTLSLSLTSFITLGKLLSSLCFSLFSYKMGLMMTMAVTMPALHAGSPCIVVCDTRGPRLPLWGRGQPQPRPLA